MDLINTPCGLHAIIRRSERGGDQNVTEEQFKHRYWGLKVNRSSAEPQISILVHFEFRFRNFASFRFYNTVAPSVPSVLVCAYGSNKHSLRVACDNSKIWVLGETKTCRRSTSNTDIQLWGASDPDFGPFWSGISKLRVFSILQFTCPKCFIGSSVPLWV